ncbi:MAG: cellulase family glycosylhydrolase, partial [Nanopusillaceae archaeon]
MMASGFWPKDWELYFKDKEKYFALLDEVINTAKKYNVGVILTLFWNVSTIPDLMGEPISAWGNPKSKTIKFMKEYTKEIVLRYKDVTAVWGYEFGNEYNLISDLPKGYQKVAPQYGTPIKR